MPPDNKSPFFKNFKKKVLNNTLPGNTVDNLIDSGVINQDNFNRNVSDLATSSPNEGAQPEGDLFKALSVEDLVGDQMQRAPNSAEQFEAITGGTAGTPIGMSIEEAIQGVPGMPTPVGPQDQGPGGPVSVQDLLPDFETSLKLEGMAGQARQELDRRIEQGKKAQKLDKAIKNVDKGVQSFEELQKIISEQQGVLGQ